MTDESVKQLRGGFSKVDSSSMEVPVPTHVLRRFDALTYGQSRVWFDLSWTEIDRSVNGTGVLFTDLIVVRATWIGTPVVGAGPPDAEKVAVEAWSRRRLNSIFLTSNGGHEKNDNNAWKEIYGEPEFWPRGPRVGLNYESRDEALFMPSAPLGSKELMNKFTMFVSTLHGDLS